MIKDVAGVKMYSVWTGMLKLLVPGGRTHRLSSSRLACCK